MNLLTKAIEARLLKNAAATRAAQEAGLPEPDHKPVVKFFNPTGSQTWLITEMQLDGTMFGLCDMGHGCPELGYVLLSDLQSIRLRFGLRIERDLHSTFKKPLSAYAEEARNAGHIAA